MSLSKTLPVSPAGRRYGYLRDFHDRRDMKATRFNTGGIQLPPSVDLLAWCGPVKDQGSLGSCTANAGCGMREFLARKYENDQSIFSPLYLYFREREDSEWGENTFPDDAGAQMRTICRILRHSGTCLESEDAYSPSDFNRKPTSAQTASGLKRRAGAYHRLDDVEHMKSCLASEYVFVLGFAVYDSFETRGMAETGLMPVPDPNKEQLLGGHAVLAIGYDDSIQCPKARMPGAFKIRNSWGTAWGQNGDFWMSYETAGNPMIVYDNWIQHMGKAW